MPVTHLQVLGLALWLLLLAGGGGRSAVRTTLQRMVGRAPRPLRLLADRADVVAAIGIVGVWLWLVLSDARPSVVDATVYWRLDLDGLYEGSAVNRVGAYLYSPVFAQVGEPFTFLRWTVWYGSWTAINLALLAWMLGPAAALLTLVFPIVSHAVWTGNIHFLVAASAVLAVRYPVAWGFPLLTKITPGVAILWHVARREWRALAIGLGATTIVAAISFAAAPSLWWEWISVLMASGGASSPGTLLPLSLPARIAIAAAVVLYGGLKGWAWTVPVAMVIAQPFFWTAGLVMLVAVVPLSRPPAALDAPTADGPAASSSAVRPG